MEPESFLYREGLRYIPDTFAYDNLPSPVRTGIFSEIILALQNRQIGGVTEAAKLLHIVTCRRLRQQYNTEVEQVSSLFVLEHITFDLLRKANWGDFLDILEVWLASVLDLTPHRPPYSPPPLVSLINNQLVPNLSKLFLEEGIGWQIDGTKITRRQAPVLESRIRETTLLLSDPKLGASEQAWKKAVDALNRRPEPDIENCIKDAVVAVEAIANIVVGVTGQELDKVVDTLANNNRVPKPLHLTLKHPFHYRGNQANVAHGTGEISKARIEDAEYVLNWAAASVVYLSKV